jgi:hypothetical protein
VISVGAAAGVGVGATLNVSGGTVSAAGNNLQIANALSTGTLAGPAVGTLNVNAGTVTIGLGGALLLNTGTTTATNFASATANINGGSLTTGTGGVVFGTSTTPDATGVVKPERWDADHESVCQDQRFGDRELQRRDVEGERVERDVHAGSGRANVKGGGAVIDTNGFNLTIAQPLLDGGGGGG